MESADEPERRPAMTTAQEVLRVAEMVGKLGWEEGVYVLRPPVMVRNSKSGGIFPVEAVDVQIGKSADGGLLQLAGQEDLCPASEFELVQQMVWTCPEEDCSGHKKGSTCAGFCTECGTALEQVPLGFVTVNTPCPECKARVVFPGDKFCPACGASLKGE